MQFFSMLATIGAAMSLISITTQQLTTETGCVYNFDNPVECVFSWIFFISGMYFLLNLVLTLNI